MLTTLGGFRIRQSTKWKRNTKEFIHPKFQRGSTKGSQVQNQVNSRLNPVIQFYVLHSLLLVKCLGSQGHEELTDISPWLKWAEVYMALYHIY